jgi:GNAT superfamily N-acetyltransferase
LTACVPAGAAIRPLRDEDVAPADRLCLDVLFGTLPGDDEEERRERSHARIRHLAETDPGGAWVAERAGELVGVALALVREGVWGFSLFAVAADLQGHGVGRALFERSWVYGEGADGHLILSSEHPAAMRQYAQTGLRLLPCVSAAGIADLSRAPDLDRVEDAGLDGVPLADAIGRELRGAGHGRDLPILLAHGAHLLVLEDRAFVVVRRGHVNVLGARDEDAARLVLWAALAQAGPGATVAVDFLTAGQNWAMPVVLDARLALSPDGPVFAGGRLGPMAPYVPSGAYL